MFCKGKKVASLHLGVMHLYYLNSGFFLHVTFQGVFLSGSQWEQIIGSITELYI